MAKRRKKSSLKQWAKAALIAILVSFLFKAFVFQFMVISTSEMEGSLYPGDVALVNKLKVGPRTPVTLLSSPFNSQEKYLDWIVLKPHRLYSKKLNRNDVLVFNVPGDGNVPLDKQKLDVKRLIALPGETMKISKNKCSINEEAVADLNCLKFEYKLVMKRGQKLSEKLLDKHNIQEGGKEYGKAGIYKVFLLPETAEDLLKENAVESVTLIQIKPLKGDKSLFPSGYKNYWNKQNYGELLVPKKGLSIKLNKENYKVYQSVIEKYEGVNLSLDGNVVLVNGSVKSNYVFTKDYYFVLGDNRDNSLDSRYWGFLPQENIVGKVNRVFFSANKTPGRFLKKL